jgi:capsular exopolysaccharide synthesis family protein
MHDRQEPFSLPPRRVPVAISRVTPLVGVPSKLDLTTDKDEAHAWDYWRVLRRRRWTVMVFFLAGLVGATVWTYATTPVFSATAIVRIDKEEPRVLKFEEVVKADPEPEFYQTQVSILRSRVLATRVIEALGLHAELRSEQPGWLSRLRGHVPAIPASVARWLPALAPGEAPSSEPPSSETTPTQAFLDRLSVKPVRSTRLVAVSFESASAPLAAQVTNTLASEFISYTLEGKLTAAAEATRFLSGQMEEAGARLKTSEESLQRFLAANDILITPGARSDREERTIDLLSKELLAVADARTQAESQRVSKESLLRQAQTQSAGSLPVVLQSPVIIKLKQDLAALEGEYRKLGQQFGPEYPRMKRVAENIAEIRQQLHNEASAIVKAVESDYQTALRTERNLTRRADEYHTAARRIASGMTQYSLLKRDTDANREHYVALLARLKETAASALLPTSNVSILDTAEVPLIPARPSKRLNLLIGGLLGLLGGVALALIRDRLDTSIKDARHAETVLGVPVTALVPSLPAPRKRAREPRALALVSHAAMRSRLAERFRALGADLIMHPSREQPPRTLVVTSPEAADGKTSIATNLAIALSQLDAGPVLLVDAEVQHPTLHRLLDVPRSPGFSDGLAADVELEDTVRATSIPGLWVIPAGAPVVSPARVIASVRLAGSLEALTRRFAHIVVDAPPLSCSATAILAARTDGVLLVVRRGRAKEEAARHAVEMLESARARLLGVVLNDAEARDRRVNGRPGEPWP